METKIKKLFAVMAIFALVLAGCDGGNTPENGNNNGNGIDNTIKETSLKIANKSSYGLFKEVQSVNGLPFPLYRSYHYF